jgi:hypothetical protein
MHHVGKPPDLYHSHIQAWGIAPNTTPTQGDRDIDHIWIPGKGDSIPLPLQHRGIDIKIYMDTRQGG